MPRKSDLTSAAALLGRVTTVPYRVYQGRREFEVAGRLYRAFWMSLGHNWSLREIGLDGQQIAPVGRISWQQKNWAAVESFIAWRAKLESGSDVGQLRIVPAGRKG